MTSESSISQYLETLISEKGRDIDANLDIEGNVTYRHLVDFINDVARDEDKAQIKANLVNIDFRNGNVFHYLDHLVAGMLKAKNLDNQ